MRKLVWIAAWIGVAFWSLFAGLTYGLFDLVSGALTAGAQPPPPDTFTSGEPHVFEWLHPFVQVGRALGLSAIGAVWVAVSAMILGGAFLVTRFLPSGRVQPPLAGRTGRGPVIQTTWTRQPDRPQDQARAAQETMRRLAGRG